MGDKGGTGNGGGGRMGWAFGAAGAAFFFDRQEATARRLVGSRAFAAAAV
jgi:hypothetical protein